MNNKAAGIFLFCMASVSFGCDAKKSRQQDQIIAHWQYIFSKVSTDQMPLQQKRAYQNLMTNVDFSPIKSSGLSENVRANRYLSGKFENEKNNILAIHDQSLINIDNRFTKQLTIDTLNLGDQMIVVRDSIMLEKDRPGMHGTRLSLYVIENN